MKIMTSLPNIEDKLDVMELMHVRGGGNDGGLIVCNEGSAVTCTSKGSGVKITIGNKPGGDPYESGSDPNKGGGDGHDLNP